MGVVLAVIVWHLTQLLLDAWLLTQHARSGRNRPEEHARGRTCSRKNMRKNRRNSMNLLNCRYLGNLLHNLDDWHLHIDWHLNHLLLDDWLLRRVAPPARPRVVLFQKPRSFSKRDKQSCLLSLPASSSVPRRLAGPLARAARLRPVPGPWRTPPCHASEERGRAGADRTSSYAVRANLV